MFCGTVSEISRGLPNEKRAVVVCVSPSGGVTSISARNRPSGAGLAAIAEAGISMVKLPSVDVVVSVRKNSAEVCAHHQNPLRTFSDTFTRASATGNPEYITARPVITAGSLTVAGRLTFASSSSKVGSL